MKQFELLSTKFKLNRRLVLIILIIIVSALFIMKITSIPNDIVPDVLPNELFVINPNEQRIHCIVSVRQPSGRLGNRMFMFASAYGLARLHSCYLYIAPERIRELNEVFIFNLSSLPISSSTLHLNTGKNLTSMNRTTMNVVCRYLPELTRPNAIAPGTIFELTGYWQSYLHFAKYGDELREHIFVATQSVLVKVSKLFVDLYQQKFNVTPQFSSDDHRLLKKQLAQSNLTTWIGIHVRRSDFVSLGFSSNNEYLVSAIKYYISLYPNAHFLVATDDKPYCKNLFRNQLITFFTPKSFSPGDDLIALSVCQHSIVTGGTFGWWAAYLTNGQVMYDKVYPSGCERREYYYPPWFMIDGKVRAGKNSEYVLK
jgi:galactoside 2-L-fucosyltransferase 1/2